MTDKKYIRDQRSSAIINTDDAELMSIMAARQKSKELRQIKSDIEMIKKELTNLKEIVTRWPKV